MKKRLAGRGQNIKYFLIQAGEKPFGEFGYVAFFSNHRALCRRVIAARVSRVKRQRESFITAR